MGSPGNSHASDLCHALFLVKLSIIQFPEDTVAAAEAGETVALCGPLFLGPALSGGTGEALLKRGSASCGLGGLTCACVQAYAPAANLVSVFTPQQPAAFPLKHRDCQQGLEHARLCSAHRFST